MKLFLLAIAANLLLAAVIFVAKGMDASSLWVPSAAFSLLSIAWPPGRSP